MEYNTGMPNGVDPSFHAHTYQWAARVSGIAFEMVIPAVIGFGFDTLLGTLPILAILGAICGMVLGFWQLIKLAKSEVSDSGVDTSSDTRDNGPV